MESKSKRARTFQGPGAAAGRDSEGTASVRSSPLVLRYWNSIVSRYCYIGIAVEVGLQVGAQRGRVAEWWWGRCPFFSILSLMRIKKMGQDRILAEAKKNLEDSAPKL